MVFLLKHTVRESRGYLFVLISRRRRVCCNAPALWVMEATGASYIFSVSVLYTTPNISRLRCCIIVLYLVCNNQVTYRNKCCIHVLIFVAWQSYYETHVTESIDLGDRRCREAGVEGLTASYLWGGWVKAPEIVTSRTSLNHMDACWDVKLNMVCG